VDEATTAALLRAKERLDTLDLYPRPVSLRHARVAVAPRFFRVPRLRRYRGYALWRTILLPRPPTGEESDDVLTHELCHVWQLQHRPVHVTWTYLTTRYRDNTYEHEARNAVERTRAVRSS